MPKSKISFKELSKDSHDKEVNKDEAFAKTDESKLSFKITDDKKRKADLNKNETLSFKTIDDKRQVDDLDENETLSFKTIDDKRQVDDSDENEILNFNELAQKDPLKEIYKPTVVLEASQEKDIGDFYLRAFNYLSYVFNSIKKRKMFSLDEGFRIIREMVEIHLAREDLLIKALHFDNQKEFPINHNINVAIYATKIGKHLEWSNDRLIELGMAALLHDIGLAAIPDRIVYKKTRLTSKEFRIFKGRAFTAYKILKHFDSKYPYLSECAISVNERLDGSGYPRNLKASEIPEFAQIIGLVDMYEALIHSRPQRVKFLHFVAVKEIIKKGQNLFQKKHLKALLNSFSIFPLHSYIKLNSNAICKVCAVYPDRPMRPKLQVIIDSHQQRVLTESYINLPDSPLLYIVDSVSEEQLNEIEETSLKRASLLKEQLQNKDFGKEKQDNKFDAKINFDKKNLFSKNKKKIIEQVKKLQLKDKLNKLLFNLTKKNKIILGVVVIFLAILLIFIMNFIVKSNNIDDRYKHKGALKISSTVKGHININRYII